MEGDPSSKKGLFYFNYLESILFFMICLFFLAGLTQKIDLTSVDLGRHLTNGRLLSESLFALEGDWAGRWSGVWKVLSTNAYSYTHPEFPFMNHHWGTGLVFYGLQQLLGFEGLSIFYSVLSICTFLIFFHLSVQSLPQSIWMSSTASRTIAWLGPVLLALPLLVSRTEIRPEGFSYFFSGAFYWILLNWKYQRISDRWLWALPLGMIFWVNLHIYFFLGFALIGFIFIDEVFGDCSRLRKLILVGVATCLAALCNPMGYQLAIYPLMIFKNYGYQVFENQSVPFFLKRSDIHLNNLISFLILFSILAALLFDHLFYHFWRDDHAPLWGGVQRQRRLSIAECLASFLFLLLGLNAIRNFTLLGLFALPCLSHFSAGLFRLPHTRLKRGLIFPGCLSLIIFLAQSWQSQSLALHFQNFGIGLAPETSEPAKFFLSHSIQGPVFNNYDVGGYLIYYLYPRLQVFVDNRPEAYPDRFFQETYIPIQTYETEWETLSERFAFNSIVFYWRDATPWGQAFLISRVKDPKWVPVYVDARILIFLKQNEQNQLVIQRFAIPKERFAETPRVLRGQRTI